MRKTTRVMIMGVLAITVLLSASSCTAPTNNEPIIANLDPDVRGVIPLGSVQVVCTASDPDGDELSYDWSASAGEINGEGDTITWIAPASEGSYSVAVDVSDGRGGEVMNYVTIEVRANDPPVIASLTASADWTSPGDDVQVTCGASDPDGDELSYDWSASGGDISGTGMVTTWTAPQEVGTYDVIVIVTDDYGREATGTILVSVLTGEPPVIEALLITAEHCYLKPYDGGYYVGKNQTYTVECIVADKSIELLYDWTCTDGERTGEGSLITWTAQDTAVEVTVTVTVSDISGSGASENIILSVVSCSPCIFGC